MTCRQLLAAVPGLWIAACGDPSSAGRSSEGQGETTAGASSAGPEDSSGETADGGSDETTGGHLERTCPPPPGVSATPTTIAQTVELINALPRPASLDCFLESLDRPLRITSTVSTVSLQPADGARSPRVFLFSGDLVMSVAIDGDGKHLLEFGEPVTPTRSLKAEIAFPLTDTLPVEAPFTRVMEGDGTSCGLCHGSEEPAMNGPVPEAFVSDALRFRDDELVELDALEAEWQACDPDLEPERCARLDAIFGHGEVLDQPFSADLPTIYDYG